MQTTTTTTLAPEQSTLLKRVTQIIAVLAILVFCAKVAQLLWIGSLTLETDVGSYFSGAQRLRDGLPLYPADLTFSDGSREHYVYPPLLALIFYPLTSYQLAWWGWAAFSLVCWAAALWLLVRELLRSAFGQQLRLSIWWPVFLAALINFPPVLVHMTWGQLQLPLLLLLTLAWLCLRRERPAAAGVLIGLTIALKLFPLLLLLPLLAQRRWRCVAAALGTAALVLGLCFAVVGWDQTVFYVTKVLPEVGSQKELYDNYSLSVSMKLWLSATFPRDLVANALRLAFLGLVAVAALRRQRAADLGLALGVTALFWVPPVVWAHYFVLAYLPLFDALTRAPRRLLASLIAAYFLIATASMIFYVPDQLVLFVHPLPVLGALLLLGVQVWLAFRIPTGVLAKSTTPQDSH
jgi:alpha-1,2-mannosyltransferase